MSSAPARVRARIQPCLWFAGQAEEAAAFYAGIFPNSRVGAIARYTEAGRDEHGMAPGSVMTVSFELDGQPFLALNGGPLFKFTEALSLMVLCETQDEIDHYWNRPVAGRRSGGAAMRLAEGPLRRLVADRAPTLRSHRDFRRPRRGGALHGGADADEEARPGRAAPGFRRRLT